MLESNVKNQVKEIFASLEANFTFLITSPAQHEQREEMTDMLSDVASTSDKITCREELGEQLGFTILKNGKPTGIRFRAVPTGHEFSSLLLAVLNADGKGRNIPDEAILRRVVALNTPVRLTTYISLTCTNCPDVVQALNLMSLLNPGITHDVVDGSLYEQEVDALKIKAVPTVYADGKLLHIGKSDFGELLGKLEAQYGTAPVSGEVSVKTYDVVILGGGPAGSSAAIYSARKGLKVALLTERIGGQVMETTGIQNLISVPQTTGAALASALKNHIGDYPIDIFEHRKVENVVSDGSMHTVTLSSGECFTSPALIVATGASWRRLNVPGEADYIGRGVAFCAHCDGPFYKGKRVAVVGGGNSGIEAAIDLAGICSHVTVFEFADSLKADNVLQEKIKTLNNVEVFLSSQTTEVIGDWEKVTGLRVKDRISGEERVVELDGVFVQIGLSANSKIVSDLVETSKSGEIAIDYNCRTSYPGIYAAGDVTTVPYKQIVIAMGEGAKASLSAFEDRIRSGK